MRGLFVLRTLSLFALAAPAVAADPAHLAKSFAKAPDPNLLLCEYVEEFGTRLFGYKVCATRSEWAQRRQGDRMGIDRGQLL